MRPSLTFTADHDAIAALASAWGWLLRAPFTPLLFSVVGDVFMQDDTGDVFWLNTGTAELSKVATSQAEFADRLSGEDGAFWLMPELVEQLNAAGKVLQPGWCYTFVTLPIFKDGLYEVANLNPVPAAEHFALTGALHAQIHDLPEGAEIDLKTTP